eukprot:gnl/Trimastix_PCT/766.p2 GENE.gnl/Trimastix_PCT/766~~gnl/Trimastix_PCT/766.p2  ORF type:complete len:291 (+),score=100.17 gnl/Trimastix_PCT/766:84-956(+)
METDLGNLTVFNDTELDSTREADILAASTECVQELFQNLVQLPLTLDPNFGSIAELPDPTTVIPRSKPIPKPRPLTNWEKFAQRKGITQKHRERLEYDEVTKEWRPQWGMNKKRTADDDIIIEHKEGDDLTVDPFEARASAKKTRIEKQKKREERNQKMMAKARGEAPAPVALSSSVMPLREAHGPKKQATLGLKQSHSVVDRMLSIAKQSMGVPAKAVRDILPTTEERNQTRRILDSVLSGGASADSGQLSSVKAARMAAKQARQPRKRGPMDGPNAPAQRKRGKRKGK